MQIKIANKGLTVSFSGSKNVVDLEIRLALTIGGKFNPSVFVRKANQNNEPHACAYACTFPHMGDRTLFLRHPA